MDNKNLTIGLTIQTKDGQKIWKGKKWDYYVKKSCSNCKKEIYTLSTNIRQGIENFCSSTCRSKFYYGVSRLDRTGDWIQVDENTRKRFVKNTWLIYKKFNCKRCFSEIFRSNQSLNKKKDVFCSSDCKDNYIMEKRDPAGYNILNNVNNLEFYYLLGLICTDGHMTWPNCSSSIKSYTCVIELKDIDDKLLLDIQKLFGGKVFYYTNKLGLSTAKWILNSKKFIIYLRDVVGLTNRKSLNLNIDKWFKTLTKEQQIYFIRGAIDGDGWVVSSDKTSQIGICSASKTFMSTIQYFFNSIFKFKRNFYKRLTTSWYSHKTILKNPMYYYYISGRNSCLRLKPLFETTIFLERKSKKYQHLVEKEKGLGKYCYV